MPMPIRLTDEMKQIAIADFTEMLNEAEISDGFIEYSWCYENEDANEETNVTVWLTQEAYRKIIALVQEFDCEVGWHGTASRISEFEYLIEDVFVYPQSVTSASVNTDQAEYTNWLHGLDDDTFNNLRMHGHSHCNLGVAPSGVDDKHRQGIVDQLRGEMFYIFIIWNKSLNTHAMVYDIPKNALYTTDEVEIKVQGAACLDAAFIPDAKEKVRRKTYSSSMSTVNAAFEEQLTLGYDEGGSRWRR